MSNEEKLQLAEYGSIAVVDLSEPQPAENNNAKGIVCTRTYSTAFVGCVVMAVTALVLLIAPISVNEDGTRANIVWAYRERHQHHHHHHHHNDEDHDQNVPLFYHKQIVDHFSQDGEGLDSFWSHRYYKTTKHFGGPGYPIFLIVGGEGPLDNGMLYPFVTDVLAKTFKAAVVQAEHRFYGTSSPVVNGTVAELLQLLTPQQAIADMLRLVNVYLRESDFRGCSRDRTSPNYCPLITVGGSYPGFLSAMFRFLHPDVVDAAYASAAPLNMYAQRTDPNIFYDIVTTAAEKASPGCPAAVKTTLTDLVEIILNATSVEDAASEVGVCADSIPSHIATRQDLGDTLVQLVSFTFASANSGNYPPGPDTDLFKSCQVFQDTQLDSLGRYKAFLDRKQVLSFESDLNCELKPELCDPVEELRAIRDENGGRDCFDLGASFPDAPPSDLVGGVLDSYDDGTMWEFQTCTTVIFLAGCSETSMFPARNATYDILAKTCQENFGVTPRPRELADMWGFDDLVNRGASRILFTNGVQDMWAGGSIMTDLSDSLLALNFENGAHHSDLNHHGPADSDTPDIKAGYIAITDILGNWIDEIKAESRY
jgi:hypothetical protein